MRKIFFALLVMFGAGSLPLHGQTIGPVISEFNIKAGKTARGSFKVQNNSLTPIAFTVEADAFTLDKYGRHVQPLTASEHVVMSPSSGRLGPKEIREIEFTIVCESACNIIFRTGMVTGRTPQGLQVKLWLDHVAYLAQSKHPRQVALVNAGLMKR
jgi:hypothetical protein